MPPIIVETGGRANAGAGGQGGSALSNGGVLDGLAGATPFAGDTSTAGTTPFAGDTSTAGTTPFAGDTSTAGTTASTAGTTGVAGSGI